VIQTSGPPVRRAASFELTLIDLPPFLRCDDQETPSRNRDGWAKVKCQNSLHTGAILVVPVCRPRRRRPGTPAGKPAFDQGCSTLPTEQEFVAEPHNPGSDRDVTARRVVNAIEYLSIA